MDLETRKALSKEVLAAALEVIDSLGIWADHDLWRVGADECQFRMSKPEIDGNEVTIAVEAMCRVLCNTGVFKRFDLVFDNCEDAFRLELSRGLKDFLNSIPDSSEMKDRK